MSQDVIRLHSEISQYFKLLILNYFFNYILLACDNFLICSRKSFWQLCYVVVYTNFVWSSCRRVWSMVSSVSLHNLHFDSFDNFSVWPWLRCFEKLTLVQPKSSLQFCWIFLFPSCIFIHFSPWSFVQIDLAIRFSLPALLFFKLHYFYIHVLFPVHLLSFYFWLASMLFLAVLCINSIYMEF